MKRVILERMQGDGKATPGSVYIDNEFVCYSIENSDKLYPPGAYIMRLGTTGRTMPKEYDGTAYEVVDVLDRTHIKWHVANYPHQLEGCTATVSSLEELQAGGIWGGGSKVATRKFMDRMEGVEEAILWVK